ncbi:MAG TPA: hypothetical protein VJ646_05100 [Candidatus Binatia bacterium]|nr:hypothetical protein [Candidatus Binatia bacterium]
MTEGPFCYTQGAAGEQMAKKGILVTGGTGLVGAYAVGMLLERG